MIYRTNLTIPGHTVLRGTIYRAQVWAENQLLCTACGTTEDDALSQADRVAACLHRADHGPSEAMGVALELLNQGRIESAGLVLMRARQNLTSSTPTL